MTVAYDEVVKARITVSLPVEQVEAAQRAVAEGRAPNVSAYLSQALAAYHASTLTFDDVIDEALGATGGPATAEENAWIDSILDGSAFKDTHVVTLSDGLPNRPRYADPDQE